MYTFPHFFITGHRGCRGYMPENSISGFVEAVLLQANAIEVDVLITKDLKVVAVHDPIIYAPKYMSVHNQAKTTIYHTSYEELKLWTFGHMHLDKEFPLQKKIVSHIPLLSEVIQSIEFYIQSNKLPQICYDIEIKSSPEHYGYLQPYPEQFCELVINCIASNNITHRCIVRSFDAEVLKYIHSHYKEIPLCLISENDKTLSQELEIIKFIPAYYSPQYIKCKKEIITFCKNLQLKVIPWTINEEDLMKKYILIGVDGIITDYPDKLYKSYHEIMNN